MATLRYNRLSKAQKNLAFDAINFCIQKFMPRLDHKLFIRVIGKENLLEKEGVYGDCDYEEPIRHNPRDFKIRVDNQIDAETFVSTIMHEMVHLKQYAKGEMKQIMTTRRLTYRWNGDRIDAQDLDYYDMPWEVEAHGRESGLVHQFLKENPYWNKFMMGAAHDETIYLGRKMPRQIEMVF